MTQAISQDAMMASNQQRPQNSMYGDEDENMRDPSRDQNQQPRQTSDEFRDLDYNEASVYNQNQDELEPLTEDDKAKMESELLFWTQGVGSIKQVGGKDIYVKSNDCEESLKALINQLKRDNPRAPYARTKLGEWGFLDKDLLPLVVFHHQDKKLSFLCLMLMV